MRPTVADIQARVARHYGLPLEAMRSADRAHKLAHARQVAMFLARRMTGQSRARIGRRFNRDQSTVFYAIQIVEQRLKTDDDLRRRVGWLRLDLELRP